ncbi:hypothetical protein CcI156_01735 [Frankia sp. CcI156]|uniref:hypothetical protein n=1 Tax=Frankia TaxID=1854 RepID=UPI0005502574|nr:MULTISPECIES: hypothetical protein [Frankia]OHV49615.1 hypothetical protein CgIS1_05210 [Frankia sp. CgIS1]ONH29605.1 hypothetical protein CcI156_01735 [Frankia sp. CcI156]
MVLEVSVVTVGVVLLLVAGVLTADLVLENSGHTEVLIMGQILSFDTWGLFVLGLATGVLVAAGVQLFLQGLARDRRRHRMERQRAREMEALVRSAPAAPAAPAAPPAPATGGPRSVEAATGGARTRTAPPEARPAAAPMPAAVPTAASSGQIITHPHRGDRIVARVADLRRRDSGGDAASGAAQPREGVRSGTGSSTPTGK